MTSMSCDSEADDEEERATRRREKTYNMRNEKAVRAKPLRVSNVTMPPVYSVALKKSCAKSKYRRLVAFIAAYSEAIGYRV